MSFYLDVFRALKYTAYAAVIIDDMLLSVPDNEYGIVDLVSPQVEPGVIATFGTLALISELVE